MSYKCFNKSLGFLKAFESFLWIVLTGLEFPVRGSGGVHDES